MFVLDASILSQLLMNPGNAYVTPNYAAVVLEARLYVFPGTFEEGWTAEETNRYIQEILSK